MSNAYRENIVIRLPENQVHIELLEEKCRRAQKAGEENNISSELLLAAFLNEIMNSQAQLLEPKRAYELFLQIYAELFQQKIPDTFLRWLKPHFERTYQTAYVLTDSVTGPILLNQKERTSS